MAETKCQKYGEHHYFIAETVGIPSEGMVYVLLVCTACSDFKVHSAKVAEPGASFRLLHEEKLKG